MIQVDSMFCSSCTLIILNTIAQTSSHLFSKKLFVLDGSVVIAKIKGIKKVQNLAKS